MDSRQTHAGQSACRWFRGTIWALVLHLLGCQVQAAVEKADVVVYGATSGGVVAAVAVAREGKSVILLEPGSHMGGLITGGLGATDTGNRGGIGGYSREFFDRVKAHYVKKYGPKSEQVRDCSEGFRFEPHVATLVLQDMLDSAKVKVRHGQPLTTVQRDGIRLQSISTAGGEFAARVFIDATYEGDLMAAAGVKYHVGREGRATHGESLAGVQAFSKFHQWPIRVPGRDSAGKPLPFVSAEPLGKPGEGDKKVQAYNFRLCMTRNKDNLVPWPRPEGYDPARYELLARYLAARPGVRVAQLMNPILMPNGKTDTNNNGPFSTDHIGANHDYPEGTPARRREIVLDHVRYTQGFCYFLANDPRVPEALRAEMASWGLAKDEFVHNGNWPTQLYIREARRMVGVHVMTQADIMKDRLKDDAIGVGSYNTDSHHVQRVLREDGSVLNEGDFQVGLSPYAIPYRALLPRPTECDNLLVSVCVSSSHVAYGTIRMEPVFMILGQAAGVAATLVVGPKDTVQTVSIAKLRDRLTAQKAVLSPVGLTGRAGTIKGIDPSKLAGIVVDDTDAKLTGEWKPSASAGPFVGVGYLHDDNHDKGKLRARLVPTIPRAGSYEVRLFYAPSSNRASNTRVVVTSRDGEKSLTVDQRKLPREGLKLGVFTFETGESGHVEIRNDETDGHVVVDAVQFIPMEKDRK